jgi:protein TonB
MNIPRYILPVSFAAVLHAALLFGFPGKTIRTFVHAIELTPPPPPPPPEDPVVLPAEKNASNEPVKPLAGGPTPPELEPVPAVTKINDLLTTEDLRPKHSGTDVKIIPRMVGPGDTDRVGFPDGELPGILLGSQLDRDPRAKVQPAPDYPARMRLDGVSGSVNVEFDVNTEGRVVRVEAVSFTHREFVEPALRAVRAWRFEPGRRHDRIVPFRMIVPIEFGLERN